MVSAELSEHALRNVEGPRFHKPQITSILRNTSNSLMTVATKPDVGYISILHLANNGSGITKAFQALELVRKHFDTNVEHPMACLLSAEMCYYKETATPGSKIQFADWTQYAPRFNLHAFIGGD